MAARGDRVGLDFEITTLAVAYRSGCRHKSTIKRTNRGKAGVVYHLLNKDGEVCYVGQARSEREAERRHQRSRERRHLDCRRIYLAEDYFTRQDLEMVEYIAHRRTIADPEKCGTAGNRQLPIQDGNPNLDDYMEAAGDYLRRRR